MLRAAGGQKGFTKAGEAGRRSETRAQQAATRAQQAATRAQQAATRAQQAATRARQAATRARQAATRAQQAAQPCAVMPPRRPPSFRRLPDATAPTQSAS